MDNKLLTVDISDSDSYEAWENERLLESVSAWPLKDPNRSNIHIFVAHTLNLILLGIILVISLKLSKHTCIESALALYCKFSIYSISKSKHAYRPKAPANSEVEYVPTVFSSALFNGTAYMGYPTNETDALWEDLYNCKILVRMGNE
jgi:hypothetical protein